MILTSELVKKITIEMNNGTVKEIVSGYEIEQIGNLLGYEPKDYRWYDRNDYRNPFCLIKDDN